MRRCNNCGWSNSDSNSKCEKCGASLDSAQVKNQNEQKINIPNEPVSYHKTVREAVPFGGNNPINNVGNNQTQREPVVERNENVQTSYKGTVNPWLEQTTPVVKCRLIPIKRMDESEELPEQLYKGEKHILNRNNLDVENQTITSKEQALLTCVEGHWYLEDKSSQQTTFVRATSKMLLKDGDVVLMGNRQFIFKEEK